MGAYIKNELLEQIQKVYPQDTVDDILDWVEAALELAPDKITVDGYTAYRGIMQAYKHGDQGEIGCV